MAEDGVNTCGRTLKEETANTTDDLLTDKEYSCGGEKEGDEEESIMKTHLTFDDYRIIVCWMEDPTKFESIHGTGEKTSVGGQAKIKKKDAFQILARHLVNKTTNPALRKINNGGKLACDVSKGRKKQATPKQV
ncbi:Hypothetical protein PHPALM_36728 [Phytophthora palmivora]|uniref:BEN domain-containing protein n=1 Tax=Phytophthora palmivora TaxID=4796 RepID=A0A2P4WZ69_9STRA|nr:Hypothetical protein PHPALM_36728 [Phytophthora palmivora]